MQVLLGMKVVRHLITACVLMLHTAYIEVISYRLSTLHCKVNC